MPINKKSKQDAEENESSDSDSENEDGQHRHPDAYRGNEEIQVDFEGRNPIDSDFHGIRQLLQQLFLKAHINLSEMSEVIIGQNYIGSVVTQAESNNEEDDEDDEMYEQNTVFGITSALNLTAKKDVTCIQELRSFLLEKAETSASDAISAHFKNVLGNDSSPVGFLINERFVNIPPQISVPLMENLYKEISRANEKKMPFNFTHFLMLIKFYRTKTKKNKPSEDVFSNSEEEVICNEAEHSFEYSVETEADTGMGRDWLEGDSIMKPYRKVVLFQANKLPQLILTIKNFINE